MFVCTTLSSVLVGLTSSLTFIYALGRVLPTLHTYDSAIIVILIEIQFEFVVSLLFSYVFR